jgi:hypothetical protein
MTGSLSAARARPETTVDDANGADRPPMRRGRPFRSNEGRRAIGDAGSPTTRYRAISVARRRGFE